MLPRCDALFFHRVIASTANFAVSADALMAMVTGLCVMSDPGAVFGKEIIITSSELPVE